VLGVGQGGVAVHGVDGRQTGVAGPGAVVPLGLEMVEERADDSGVEVGEVEVAPGFPSAARSVTEQQTERVTIGADSVRAGLLLVYEPPGEKAFQGGGDRRSSRARAGASRRLAARAGSSGTAERYQYVPRGST